MKVIFIKDLKHQGKVDEIKEVSDGYATNFLIKNGYAVKYTKTSNERLEKDIKEREIKEENNINEAKLLAAKLAKEEIIFKVKVGKNNKIFGNISTKQISEELTKLGYSIDKKKINMIAPLNTLGNHLVKVTLHKKVEANLLVKITE